MIALFFDTETTGFKKDDFIPEIVQIGAILQDTESRRVLGELNTIIRPANPIPQVVSDIHRITDELAAAFGMNSGRMELVFAALAQKADILVAHNIQFDVGIIRDAWPIASKIMDTKEQFCTMINTTDILKLPPKGYSHGKYKSLKMVEAYAYFFDGQTFDNAHDAMADVRACRDVYFALKDLK